MAFDGLADPARRRLHGHLSRLVGLVGAGPHDHDRLPQRRGPRGRQDEDPVQGRRGRARRDRRADPGPVAGGRHGEPGQGALGLPDREHALLGRPRAGLGGRRVRSRDRALGRVHRSRSLRHRPAHASIRGAVEGADRDLRRARHALLAARGGARLDPGRIARLLPLAAGRPGRRLLPRREWPPRRHPGLRRVAPRPARPFDDALLERVGSRLRPHGRGAADRHAVDRGDGRRRDRLRDTADGHGRARRRRGHGLRALSQQAGDPSPPLRVQAALPAPLRRVDRRSRAGLARPVPRLQARRGARRRPAPRSAHERDRDPRRDRDRARAHGPRGGGSRRARGSEWRRPRGEPRADRAARRARPAGAARDRQSPDRPEGRRVRLRRVGPASPGRVDGHLSRAADGARWPRGDHRSHREHRRQGRPAAPRVDRPRARARADEPLEHAGRDGAARGHRERRSRARARQLAREARGGDRLGGRADLARLEHGPGRRAARPGPLEGGAIPASADRAARAASRGALEGKR